MGLLVDPGVEMLAKILPSPVVVVVVSATDMVVHTTPLEKTSILHAFMLFIIYYTPLGEQSSVLPCCSYGFRRFSAYLPR